MGSLRNHWWKVGRSAREDGCGVMSESEKMGRAELKLEKLAGVFYILISGLVLALIVSSVEFFYKSKREAEKHGLDVLSVMRAKARASFGCRVAMETNKVYTLMELMEYFGRACGAGRGNWMTTQ